MSVKVVCNNLLVRGRSWASPFLSHDSLIAGRSVCSGGRGGEGVSVQWGSICVLGERELHFTRVPLANMSFISMCIMLCVFIFQKHNDRIDKEEVRKYFSKAC